MNEDFLVQKLSQRDLANTLRILPAPSEGIDFSSNDYLGLARNPQLHRNILDQLSAQQAGSGSSGSRLLTGNSPLHEETESILAKIFKAEATSLFSSGYSANLALLSSVPQRGDTIIYDDYCHASIKEGIRLSSARYLRFKHNNFADLRKKLDAAPGRKFVIVESVYSMDGDICDFEPIITTAKEYGSYLIVDEAHSTGVFGEKGQGLTLQLGIADNFFARVYTFGKGVGLHGACIAGSSTLKQYLINFARSFIYTTASAPSHLIGIQESFAMLKKMDDERASLFDNIEFFSLEVQKHSVSFQEKFILNSSPIQGILAGDAVECKRISKVLKEEGYHVFPILSPTVPEGKERIRICLHSYNTSHEIRDFINILSNLLH